MDDISIHADTGSTNPFKKTISGKNYYTLYVVSDDVSQKVLDKLKGANICKVDSKVKKVMICHRHQLAHLALGRYGPIGTEISTQLFLEARIDVVHM